MKMQLHCWRRYLTIRRSGGLLSRILLFVPLALLLIHYIFATNNGVGSATKESHYISFDSQNNGEELLPIYDLPSRSRFFSSKQYDPPHLAPIDPSTLIYKGAHPIDTVHLNGYLHTGHVLFIMDASGKILFLQRSANVVTCPNAWSVLGEHTSIDDGSPWETVIRGIEEELGFRAFGHDTKDFPSAWTADLHPSHVTSKIKTGGSKQLLPIRVTIRNVTEYPLYYIRHYGSRNGHRVDRQLTYLWLVHFPKREELISWQLDAEVANLKWINLQDASSWLSNDAANVARISSISSGSNIDGDAVNQVSSGATGSENEKHDDDDGPDRGDFCHSTIRSLYEVALAKMIDMI